MNIDRLANFLDVRKDYIEKIGDYRRKIIKPKRFLKPDRCYPEKTGRCYIPTHGCDTLIQVDYCIADIVSALNAAKIHTSTSCCGHGEKFGNIILTDGRVIFIYDPWIELEKEENGSVAQLVER